MNMTPDEILNMPAGREMDALIATQIMGWVVDDLTAYSPTGSSNARIPHGDEWLEYYSTDIAAAWQVIDKLDPFDFELVRNADKSWDCLIWNRAKENRLWEAKKIYLPDVSDAPLAICRAALLAVQSASPTHDLP